MRESLPPTPGQTVGPFFHDALVRPGEDALVTPGSAGAVRLHGTVLDGDGAPVPDALIEIRQSDPDGWGRSATDDAGHYAFTAVLPDAAGPAAFFAVTVFARGLLDRLFTRAYLPGQSDAFLAGLTPAEAEALQIVGEDDGGLRFDVHLQGDHETVFLRYPRHRG